jgi:hypothetical protein
MAKTIKHKKKPPVKQKRMLVVPPAPATMQAFITHYGDMFNLAEIERTCGMPSGTMRHIRTGSRVMTWDQYEAVRKNFLPMVMEMGIILQNYLRQMHQIEVGF